jgi:hypothetical protein
VTLVRLEDFVGKPVRDADGRVLGHLHDARAEQAGGELVVVDYLIGPAGFLERFSIAGMARSVLGIFGLAPTKGYVVSAREMDLSAPGEPRCTRRAADLKRTGG